MPRVRAGRPFTILGMTVAIALIACQQTAPNPGATPTHLTEATKPAAPIAANQSTSATIPAAAPTTSPVVGTPVAMVPAPSSTAVPLSGMKIKIVSSLPRSGTGKSQTDSIVNAIRMALEDVAYRVAGATVEYEDLDDTTPDRRTTDPLKVAENANQVVADPDVMIYLGPGNSGGARVAIPILCPAEVVMISMAATAPGLTKQGKGAPNEPDIYYPNGCKRNFARVIASDEIQGAGAAWWAEGLGATKAYILDDGGPYGRAIATLFQEAADHRSLHIVGGPESINSEAADFLDVADRIRSTGANLVFYGGTNPNNLAGRLWRDLRARLGPDVKLMGADGISNQSFLDGAGEAAEGTFVTLPGVPPAKLSGRGADWYQRYKTRFGTEPESFAANAAEATQVALRAIRRVGVKDRVAIRDAILATQDYDGLLGTWSFAPTGDISLRDMTGIRVVGGKFDMVNAEPFPAPLDQQGQWQKPLEQVDAVWDRDWPRAIQLLDEFRARYRYYGPAKNKLYAARVSYGQQLISGRQCDRGREQLTLAEKLNQDERLGRGEAAALLGRGC